LKHTGSAAGGGRAGAATRPLSRTFDVTAAVRQAYRATYSVSTSKPADSLAADASPPLAPRNATEDAILEAARELLSEGTHEQVTIDTIARRAFVSRTTVYFYFENKRAVMDRLIQQAFADMDDAASPYFTGSGDPRMELALGLARFVGVVNRNGPILMLAAHLYGEDEHMPSQWEPYVNRFIAGAEARIARDQLRGLAPGDIPARVAAQALCAMVERHLTIEVIRNGRDMREAVRQLTELWFRAVYAGGGAPG
jgi:TetR/AcrR family transcriptional regulator, ethionamide resistance regulator